MSRIAIDAVLLPDKQMSRAAIEANRKLLRKYGRKIVLDAEDCLPHISLAMGCADDADLAHIGQIINAVAEKTILPKLKAIGVATSTNAVGEKVSAFEVENTPALRQLHERVMKELGPYLSYDVTADMCFDRQAERSTLLWISSYRDKSSFANFFPHITIGYGETEPIQEAIEFDALKLAACHLGNHCTCRRILFSTTIKTT